MNITKSKRIQKSFPKIVNKDDFIRHIDGKDELCAYDKGEYTLLTYNVNFADTFDTPESRECRGMIFDNSTGKVIRRPLHKFFNVGERPETDPIKLRGKKIDFVVDKKDGSMLSPFILNDDLIWGTKGISSDFVEHFDKTGCITKNYNDFAKHVISLNITPIFEFHDPNLPDSVIVINYDRPFITLLAMREMTSGKYIPRAEMISIASKYDIPVVEEVGYGDNIDEIILNIRPLEGVEGAIVSIEGELYKIKTDWYFLRHKAIDMFSSPKTMARICLGVDGFPSIDDTLPQLNDSEKEKLLLFSKQLKGRLEKVAKIAVDTANKYSCRRAFASSNEDKYIKGYAFLIWDIKSNKDQAEKKAFEYVLKRLTSFTLTHNKRLKEWENMVDNL